MAQPSGRGNGTTADDLYALGVTLVALMVGGNPARQLDNDWLLNAKIERGSYSTHSSASTKYIW